MQDLPTDITPLEAPESFLASAADTGIVFEEGDVARLGAFLALVLEVNQAFNLTGITDPEEAWTRHILDSLTLLQTLPEAPGLTLLDVGAGAGFPGIPIAITQPSLRVTLLDATAKKARFLQHAKDVLALRNVRVVNDRAERAAHDRGTRTTEGREGGHRDAYDIVVARAVGRTATVVELTIAFAKVGGLVVLIKGQKAEEELAEAAGALSLLGAAHAGTIATPTGRLVVIEKRRPTPRDYPRRDGEPKRAPLGV